MNYPNLWSRVHLSKCALNAFLLALLPIFHLPIQAMPLPEDMTPVERFKEKWALIIGIGDFAEPSWNLKYAVKDATDFKEYLTAEANFEESHVKVLTGQETSKTAVNEALKRFAECAGKDDLMLIYIRTRGTLPHFVASGESYLAMPDTNKANIEETAIKMIDFAESIIERIHAKTIAIIEDADYAKLSNGAGPGLVPLMGKSQTASLVFLGCGPLSWESKSYPNSIFTHNLLERLHHGGPGLDLFHAFDGLTDKMCAEAEEIRHLREETAGSSGFGHEGSPMRIFIAAPAKH